MAKIKINDEKQFLADFFQMLFGMIDSGIRLFPAVVFLHFFWVLNSGEFGEAGTFTLSQAVLAWGLSGYFWDMFVASIAWGSLRVVVGKITERTVAPVGTHKSVEVVEDEDGGEASK